MFRSIELILRKYSKTTHFAAIVFIYKTTRLVYKYPIEYDNDVFKERLCNFIANDLSKNAYNELSVASNTFYVDIIKDEIEYVNPTIHFPFFRHGNLKFI